jgi:hypothetical protein
MYVVLVIEELFGDWDGFGLDGSGLWFGEAIGHLKGGREKNENNLAVLSANEVK